MAYNHGKEERKWRLWKEAEEKILRESGVDENIIEEIRIYDRTEFNSDRRFYRRLNDMEEYIEKVADDGLNTEIKTVSALLDEIENEHLYAALLGLGRGRIPSPLQKAGAWRFQLAPYKRRGAGDHAGTIPGADAGAGDRIQAPDPGSAAQRSPVIHCAKRRNLKIFSGPPSQIQWKLSTSGFHTIHSLKSTPQRSAAVWISTLKN